MSDNQTATRSKPTCPACGWTEPFWQDPVPTTGCLLGHLSAPCPPQLSMARAAAERRRFCPEAFDANGNILPGGLVMILNKVGRDRAQWSTMQ